MPATDSRHVFFFVKNSVAGVFMVAILLLCACPTHMNCIAQSKCQTPTEVMANVAMMTLDGGVRAFADVFRMPSQDDQSD